MAGISRIRTRSHHSPRTWQLAALLLAALSFLPSIALAQAPPATPASVTLTRADGTVTADWPAVSGATKYHVTYSTNNRQSWSLAAFNHGTNSITISGADNAKTYIVGVRAGNAAGWSGWHNSDPAAPYTPPTPAPNPPATPSSVTVTRGAGTVAADWPAVSGAAKYHVTYSSDGGQSWTAASDNHAASSITISGADNAKTYVVGVRAGNDAGWSGWRNSPAAGPYTPPAPNPPSAPSSVTVTRGDGTVTASWPAVTGATKYHITYSANGKHTWTAASDNHTGTSITITANNGKTYVVAVRAGNAAGWSGWTNSAASAPTTTPGIIVQDSNGNAITTLTVPEGGEATYQVKLASKPDAYVEICIGLSVRDRNDGSITFKGEPAGTVAIKVPFTPDNWNTAQTVTLVAAEDDDVVNGVRDVINDTRDFVEYFSGAVWLAVTEIDNDLFPSPANLSVTPGDGYLDIAWDAVTGATGYDVKAKTADATDWHDVAGNVTGTSHRYTTGATIDYVGVRARSTNGTGPWTELSRAPASDWLNTVQQSGGASLQAGAMSMASAQSQSKLTAPTLGTITRDNGTRETGSDRSITINWNAVTGATGYNVVCSATDGWSWWQCGAITSGTTTTLTVDNGESGNDLGKNRSYKLAVRAVNATPADASDWTNSANIRPVTGWPQNVAATRGDGSITLSWTPNAWTTGYNIDCAISDRTPPYSDPVYTRCAALTGQDDTAATHTVTIPHSTNSSYTIDNTKHYDIKITSTNQWGQAEWLAPIIAPLSMSAGNVGLTSATLNIASSYTGAWWYKRTAPTEGTCQSVSAGTTSADLSSLTSGGNYTYKAYSKTGCNSADEIASVSFSTSASVSNLSETSDTIGSAVHSTQFVASGFRTGDNAGGYNLLSVTAKFRNAVRNPTGFVAEIRLEGAGGDPSDNVLYTLSGPDPTSASDHTFTCSGSCQLSASTPYFLVMKGGSFLSGNHVWDTTASNTETNAPSDFGWTIADEGKTYSGSSWSTDIQWVGMFKVSATKNQTLTASDATAGQATLTITNWTGAWYYKADTGPHATCQGPVNGTTVNLSNLVKGTRYNYSAYSDDECTNLLATASAFITPSITVSNIGTTSATIRLFNFAAQWWYKADSGPDGSCQGHVGARDNESLTGLTQGTPYLYKAYSKSGCAETDYVTDVYFTTTAPGLTVSNITDTAATLNLAGHSSDWYYKANASPDNTCKGPVTNSTTKDLTGLTSGSTYTYEAFSDSGCTTANRLATATAFTTGASYVTNLSSANTGQALISDIRKQAVAFTTGSNANGYTLSNITASLREPSDGGSLTVTLHQMQGTGTYGTGSSPSSTALATLTGTDPTNIAWADTTYTCSGSGCSLSANTTYFVVMESSRAESFAWSVATTETESTYPANSGWNIGYGHAQDSGNNRPWFSHGNYYPVRVVFTTTAGGNSVQNTAGVTVLAALQGTDSPANPAGAAAQASNLAGGTANAHEGSGWREAAAASATGAPGYVTNLASARSGDSDVDATGRQAVAFTTGPSLGGYTLKSVTAALRNVSGNADLVLTLHEMASTAYGDDSQPAVAVLATLSGSAPASGAFADVTYTCSGQGCDLDPDTTYFVVAESTGAGAYAWAYVASANLYTESTYPVASGWDIGSGHYSEDGDAWTGWGDWHHARLDFETRPVLSVGNLDEAPHQDACFPSGDTRCAVGFTTGSASGGYTLRAITARFDAADDPDGMLGDLVVALHAAADGIPGQALATLNGANPTEAGDYTYTCSDAGCMLKPDTTYFVQVSATAGASLSEAYTWSATLSGHETAVPAGTGWTLADGTTAYRSTWETYPDVGLVEIFVTP